MTEQTEQSEYFDDVDKLNVQLEHVQKLHADSLRELQETEGKLLDKSRYNEKRKLLTEAHEQASRTLIQTIEDTKEANRKQLALNLLYAGESETERRAWAENIRMVEGAKTIEQQEELLHRALRWGDSSLARALVFKLGGRPEYKALVEVLAGVDSRVKAIWNFERKHGAYAPKNAAASQTWAGWQTYQGRGNVVDIPGRPAEQQPAYRREQRRLQFAQGHGKSKR